MFCTRCQNPVAECECGDIEERLRSLAEHSNFATDRCSGCQRHPEDCTCEEYTPITRDELREREIKVEDYLSNFGWRDGKTTECWRCGRQRYTFESCHHCGASCKPLTKKKQQDGWTGKDTEWWLTEGDEVGGDGR